MSEGLLDKPEDATYYNYHLADPKDAPYASFRFHYRSWENLEQLQLTRSRDSRLSPSGSARSVSSGATASGGRAVTEEPEDQAFSFEFPYHENHTFCIDGQSYEDDHGRRSEGKQRQVSDYSNYSSPLQDVASPGPYQLPSAETRQLSKTNRAIFGGSYLQRPLPNLPFPETPESPRTSDWSSRHSGTSSIHSLASIAPSLHSKLSCDSFATDQVEYDVATAVEVIHSGQARLCGIQTMNPAAVLQQPKRTRRDPQADHSISDYDSSLVSNDELTQPSLPSPGRYLVTTGSQLERQLASFQSPAREQVLATPTVKSRVSPKARRILGDDVDSDLSLPRVGTLKLTEHEWLMGGRNAANGGPPARMPEARRGMWSPPPSGRRRSTRPAYTVEKHNSRNGNYLAYDGEGEGNWI